MSKDTRARLHDNHDRLNRALTLLEGIDMRSIPVAHRPGVTEAKSVVGDAEFKLFNYMKKEGEI